MTRMGLKRAGFSSPRSAIMMFAGWLRPHRVLIAVGAVATGALACRDTTTPTEFSKAGIPDPSFTAAVGFTGTPIGRGNLGPFHVKSKAAGYDVELKSRDNTDIAVANVVVAAGGNSGWHTHPGPVLVVVKTGTITHSTIAAKPRKRDPRMPPARDAFTPPVPHSLRKAGLWGSRATKRRR